MIKAKTLFVKCNVSGFQSLYYWGERKVEIERFLGFQER